MKKKGWRQFDLTDLLILVGVGLITYGLNGLHPSLGVIFVGAACCGIAFITARG